LRRIETSSCIRPKHTEFGACYSASSTVLNRTLTLLATVAPPRRIFHRSACSDLLTTDK